MDLNTISEVVRPKARHDLPGWRPGDTFLAGGTWLFSEPQPTLNRLIDLSTLEWNPLQATADGLEIAATCTIAKLDAFSAPTEWKAATLFGQCCRAFLASFKIWNTATVGGNICMSLPAGPMISLAVALDGVATLWAQDGGERKVAVAQFVTGPQRNELRSGELMRRIFVPKSALTSRAAFRQISLAHYGRSGALIIGTLAANGKFALTITASTPRPYKLVFTGLPTNDVLRTRIDAGIANDWYDDIHGSPGWRRHMSLHFAQEIRDELAGGAR
jgi:CO/xanthine dehydrogenase FAD-binding subunit